MIPCLEIRRSVLHVETHAILTSCIGPNHAMCRDNEHLQKRFSSAGIADLLSARSLLEVITEIIVPTVFTRDMSMINGRETV